jgi:RNA polymerase sigma-70 factor (ECF subfamily)
MENLSDEDLVNRAKRGDQEAFRVLHERYAPSVHKLLYRWTGDPEEAEDLTQEVFIAVFQGLQNFRGESSFKTWIFQIANHKAIDSNRKRKRQVETVSPDDFDETQPDDREETRPEEALLRKEMGETLRRKLQELPEDSREAIVLCDLQGLSYEECAEALGITVGAFKSRLRRARQMLKEKMRPYMEGDGE